MVSTFCDQVVAKQAVESCTGKINLKVSLDIIQEKCTGRFHIVSSDGFQEMRLHNVIVTDTL